MKFMVMDNIENSTPSESRFPNTTCAQQVCYSCGYNLFHRMPCTPTNILFVANVLKHVYVCIVIGIGTLAYLVVYIPGSETNGVCELSYCSSSLKPVNKVG